MNEITNNCQDCHWYSDNHCSASFECDTEHRPAHDVSEYNKYHAQKQYEYYYGRARLKFTLFWFWSSIHGYDILHGDLKRAWDEYMQDDDEFAEEARQEYIGNKIAKKAFRDYCRNYIQEVRENESRYI